MDAQAALREATRGTPWEGDLWLVGGVVRDELLGVTTKGDLDLVTTGDAVALAERLWKVAASSIPPVTYPRFGTAMVRIEGVAVELVTARRESYDEASRKPDVEPATLEEDAARRDFTANALLRNLHSGELYDPTGRGLNDLQARVLDTPLDPAATFKDDPLRMLRAVRFKHQLGFALAERVVAAIRQQAERLQIVSEERIQAEWTRMLVQPEPDKAMRDLRDLRLLIQFAPEFEAMVGVEQGDYHHLDVWDHTLVVLRNAHALSTDLPTSDRLDLALAALLHDVGKPSTRMVDADGRTRFFGHESVGAEIAGSLLRRLKFSNDATDRVVKLVKNHMRLGSAPEFSAPAARRLLRDLAEDVELLLRLVESDAQGLKPGVRRIDLEPIRQRLSEVAPVGQPASFESPLSGEEIMTVLRLTPGPEVGRWKHWLSEQVLDGKLSADDRQGAVNALMAAHRQPEAR